MLPGLRINRAAGALALVLMLATGACTQGATSQPTPTKTVVGGTMTIRLNALSPNIDLHNFADSNQLSFTMAMYDRLVAIDGTGKVLPYLAETWTTTSTSVAFTIRRDATCADGTPITATVVANSFKRYIAQTGSARFFGEGASVTSDEGARSFTMKLAIPYSDALYLFADRTAGIICPAGLVDPKQLESRTFGSGPFVIESGMGSDTVNLRVRPEWKWGPFGLTAQTAGFPDKLVIRVIPNETTAANLLLTGGLDVGQVSGPDVARLRASPELNYVPFSAFTNFVMAMNESPGRPTADEKVREALMAAVDPKEWNQAANGGLGKVGTSVFAPNANCFDPTTASLMPTNPSPDKARAILLAAGYTLGANGKLQKDGKPLVINVVANNSFGNGPEYIAEQFNKAAITAVLTVTPNAINSVSYRAGNFDVGFPTLLAPSPGVSRALSIISGAPPPAGINIPRLTDPYIDQEVAAGTGTTGAQQCQHFGNVQRRYLEKHHLLPLAAPETAFFGRGINFFQNFYLEPTSLKRRG